MRVLFLLSLAVLASCGAEGDPIPPASPGTGVSISGEASAGVVVGG